MARLLPHVPLPASHLAMALSAMIAGVGGCSSRALADPAPFPKYDIAKACRAQAEYAFAATLGQTDINREVAACSDRERDNMVSARTFWPRVSPKDLADCLVLAEERYGRLSRCLETSPSLRTSR